jgi:hypothetical protein
MMGTMVYVEDIAVELDSDYEPWSHWIRYKEVTGFSDFQNIRIARAYPAEAGQFGVEITVDAEAEVNVWISKEAWWSRPPRSTTDFDTDEDSWEFPVPATGKATLEYWSRYSVEKGDFIDHQLTEVRNRPR